jgi:hypothetical protein
MLVGAAADRLEVDASACKTDRGVVVGPSGQRIAYAELVGDAAKRPLPDFKTIPLKDEKSFRIVGTNVPRVDMPSKVNGTAKYGIDVRVPGMLFAVVSRCPTFGGKAVRFDAQGQGGPGREARRRDRPDRPRGRARSGRGGGRGREHLGRRPGPGRAGHRMVSRTGEGREQRDAAGPDGAARLVSGQGLPQRRRRRRGPGQGQQEDRGDLRAALRGPRVHGAHECDRA